MFSKLNTLSLAVIVAALWCQVRGLDFYSDNGPPACSPVFAPGLFVPLKQPAVVNFRSRSPEQSPESPYGFLLYNFEDEERLGASKSYFCHGGIVGQAGCTNHTIGRIFYSNPADPPKHHMAFGWSIAAGATSYNVNQTGLYCLRVGNPNAVALQVQLDFQNPYGKLIPELFPLFKLAKFLLFGYCIYGVTWIVLSYRHRAHLVSLQHYLGLALGLFALEMAGIVNYYHQYNTQGVSGKWAMFLMITLTSVRATVTLYLLLIASMGYGVVSESLGARKTSIYLLTGTHLVFSLINSFAGSSSSGQGNMPIVFLSSLPLAMTYSIFFSRILAGLSTTKESLSIRKQRAKLGMFNQLTWVLYIFFISACVFMVIASLTILTYNESLKWYAKHWKWLWLYSSGWPILLNFICCSAIAWIFRPRDYNRNYGLDEISEFPLDEEDLELQADLALQTLRSGRQPRKDLRFPHEDGDRDVSRSFGGGHSRWNTDTIQPFGADESDNSAEQVGLTRPPE